MKKFMYIWLLLCLTLLLPACTAGQPVGTEQPIQGPTWQEQYDLGLRYLEEGNYEEAILAFTAAIEIDPKRPEPYIGLADAYTGQGDAEKALEILRQGLEQTGDAGIEGRIADAEAAAEAAAEPWFLTTAFTYNPKYEDLTPEEQQIVADVVEAAERQDWDRAWELLKDPAPDQTQKTVYFTYGKYRIMCKKYDHMEMEIHPREGTGFLIKRYREPTKRYQDIRIYAVGSCRNWNWEGGFEYYEWADVHDDSDYTWYHVTETGTAKNGLLDGTLTHMINWSNGQEHTQIEIYENGVQISSGPTGTEFSGRGPGTIYTIGKHQSDEYADKYYDWSK